MYLSNLTWNQLGLQSKASHAEAVTGISEHGGILCRELLTLRIAHYTAVTRASLRISTIAPIWVARRTLIA